MSDDIYAVQKSGAVDDGDVIVNGDVSTHHPDPVATVATTAINITSNVVGAGVLAIPAAVAQMSVIPGIITLTIFAFLSGHSMLLLTLCAQRTGCFTYKDLINRAFNTKRAGRAFDLIIFLYTFGCCVAYAGAVADSMPPVMEDFVKAHGVAREGWFWLLMASIIFFPLSSLKQLSELKVSSAFGFAMIVYVVGVVVVQFFTGSNEPPGDNSLISKQTPWFDLSWNYFQGLPLASVGFSCHYNVPVFFGEMRHRSPSKMMRAVITAIPGIYLLYFFASFCSVTRFPSDDLISKGDIMKNFPTNDTAMNIGRLGMFIHFVCVYPILCIASRRSFNSLVFNRGSMSRPVYALEAFFLVATSCLLAWRVDNVGVVFDFIGAMFGISIVVVIPNLLYLRLIPVERDREDLLEDGASPEVHTQYHRRVPSSINDEDNHEGKSGSCLRRLNDLVEVRHKGIAMMSRVLIVVGLILSVIAFSIDVKKQVDKADDHHDNTSVTGNATTMAPILTHVPTAPHRYSP